MLSCTCQRRTLIEAAVLHAPPDARRDAVEGLPSLPRLPDSALVKASEAYLASVSSPVMVRHCIRSYYFGHALAEKASLKPDREELYIACLFHDLGLEPQFDSPGDFETAGANAARNFLTSHDASATMADRVAEAIDLHTEIASATHPRAEVACVHMGTFVDVFGARLDQIDARFVQKVITECPRDGMKALVGHLLKRQIDMKPGSRLGLKAKAVDVVARVNAAPFTD